MSRALDGVRDPTNPTRELHAPVVSLRVDTRRGQHRDVSVQPGLGRRRASVTVIWRGWTQSRYPYGPLARLGPDGVPRGSDGLSRERRGVARTARVRRARAPTDLEVRTSLDTGTWTSCCSTTSTRSGTSRVRL